MTAARRRPSGEGGAYLLALTVLLVLTGLGIVLSESASMERRLGSADQARLQALNAADSGLAIASAHLLAGEEARERRVVFGPSGSPLATRVSRVTIAAPTLTAVRPCRSCDSGAGSFGRVSYALSATGELALEPSPLSPLAPRVLARAAVEALVTLQPWPVPGSATDPGAGFAPCSPEQRAGSYTRLARELHPPGCRFGPQRFEIASLDLATGAVCTVRLPVCVLLTEWREL